MLERGEVAAGVSGVSIVASCHLLGGFRLQSSVISKNDVVSDGLVSSPKRQWRVRSSDPAGQSSLLIPLPLDGADLCQRAFSWVKRDVPISRLRDSGQLHRCQEPSF